MKYLIKLIYKFHRETVLNEVVADFYKEVPKEISEPAVSILKDKRRVIDNWIAYQAFVLQRRIATNKKGIDTVFGMLVQLRVMKHLISGGVVLPEKADGAISIKKAKELQESKKKLDEILEGVKTFKNKK